jgi:hypothetical protein
MFECSCGKKYKYASGLTNHKEKCSNSVGGGAVAVAVAVAANDAVDDITKSPFFTIPLTSFKPTANFTKEDLELLEKRKQARLKSILQSQQEEKDKKAMAAAAKSHSNAAAAAAAADISTGGTVITNNTSNVGNEEHNASFNIKYVRRSEETQQVVRAVTAAAHEYCKGRIIVTSDDPIPGGSGIHGISTTVNEDGTTVYNHPTRTISIIETPPEDVSPEEEHDITLEKMTYLILSLIQKNNKLTKENTILRQIVNQLNPTYFD